VSLVARVTYGYSLAICSFVDWDMLMRHFGYGVGHLQYGTQTQQDSDTETESGMMGDANSISDNDTGCEEEHDREVDIEEEGELEGELESNVDCDGASTIASEDESEGSKDDSDNYLDGYASF
jgi:hypothetical protein